MKRSLKTLLAAILALALLLPTLALGEEAVLTAAPQRVRTIITTDGEADDQCSLVRYLLYANEFELEGIVSTSSMFHYTEQGPGRFKGKDSNQQIIDAYAKVYDNLCLHAEGYPTPEFLTTHNFEGNVTVPGEMATDTEGSLFIKEIILDERTDRLLLQAWGGCNTIAAALRSIEDEYKQTEQWSEIYQKICDKVIIFNDLDQDETVSNYFIEYWENLPIIMTHMQYTAIGYDRDSRIPQEMAHYYSAEWMTQNIANRGALSDIYGQIIGGERSKGAFLSEGDTPCYFYALDVGLRSFEDPSFGGWAGRFYNVYNSGPKGYDTYGSRWSSAKKILGFFTATTDDGNILKPLYRWIDDFQNDFAARMDWCVKPYAEANHEPVVQVAEGLDLTAHRGETVTLTAKTYDPDGDNVNVVFWQYGDADTYGGTVELKAKGNQVSFVVPEDAIINNNIHIIAEAQDDGKLPITRYQRVIITIVADEEAAAE